MNDHSAQSPGDYPSAPHSAGNPNSGCAVAAACVAFIFSIFVLSNFVFVNQEQRLVETGGFFSSAKYEEVPVTSWFPVMFWTAIFCCVVYGLVLWKRSKPFIWLAIGAGLVLKQCADAQKRANSAKPVVPSYQTR
ncbi:MAG: hypothetical protein WAW39_30140 [Prosthecobacter sp.]|uniref:hypothetical protein n=1 Tax=Prosthecobacter sp. TaxID=1965333 RepID=UPI003BAE2E37